MSNLFDLLFKKQNLKSKVHLEMDEKNEKCIIEVEGSVVSILTALSILAHHLKEKEIPEELISGAIEIGLKDENSNKKPKIIEKTIVIDSEQKAEKIKKFLEDLED